MKEITTLDELRSIELEVMKKIHSFCVEKNIQYYLSYGSLIGAVRHNGFIPWDDDIDIVMPRPDYEKFCKLFPLDEKTLGLMLVNNSTSPRCRSVFSKVIDKRTQLVELDYKGDDPIGVFVDVFPLDGISPNKVKQQVQIFACKFIQMSLMLKKEVRWRKNLVKCIIKVILFGVKWDFIVNTLNKLIQINKYDSKSNVICFVDPYHYAFNKSCLSPMLHRFEDTEFFIPSGYDDILRGLYGDYMKLPPLQQQVPHHISNIYWK